MSEHVLLSISDPQTIGVHMRTLIDLWVEYGLTDGQRLALQHAQTQVKELDDRFTQFLALDKSWYNQVFDNILMNLNYWEELPAWQEVCLLKGYCDRASSFAQSVSTSAKRYALIILEFYSQETYDSDCCVPHTRDSDKLVPYFWEMSTWYQSMFHRYQDRQFLRLYSLERSMKTSLASGEPLYITLAEDVYPPSWMQALEAWAEPEDQVCG